MNPKQLFETTWILKLKSCKREIADAIKADNIFTMLMVRKLHSRAFIEDNALNVTFLDDNFFLSYERNQGKFN